MRGDAQTPERRYWPNFLRGEPREIHARLLENDPLRLRERCAVRLRARWILIEPDRAFARSAACAALCAAQDQPPPDLEKWAIACIDKAFEQILASDRAAELAGDPPDEEQRTFPLLTDCLMVAPERVRSVALAFQALEDPVRRAFFELLVEGREVLQVLQEGPWVDADQLHDHTHASLRVFGHNPPPRTRSLVSIYPKSAKAPGPDNPS
ncbi:MAG: hypothetical protein ABL998_05750 [Planctomycetota bacterium]